MVEPFDRGRLVLIDWLLPAGLSDREEVRRARLTAGMAALLVLATASGAGYSLKALGLDHVVTLALMTMMLLFGSSVVLLRRTRRVRPAAVLLILTLLCGAVFVGLNMGGIRSPQLAFFSISIMLGGFLTGRRAALLFGLFAEAALATYYGLEVAGVSLPVSAIAHPELRIFMINAVAVAIAVLSVSLYESARTGATAQLAASEANLGALVGNTRDGIWSVDRELRPITVNPMARERLAGGARDADWEPHYRRALAGEPFTVEIAEAGDGDPIDLEVAFNPIRRGGDVAGVAVCARDISERKRQARRLEAMQHELLVVSRLAGMAEVAADVLHNVGNALNGVTVSAGLLREQVRTLRPARLGDLAEVIDRIDRGELDLGAATLPRAADYLRHLRVALESVRERALDELGNIDQHLAHIASLLATQQARAGSVQVIEMARVEQIVSGAVRVATAMLGRQLPIALEPVPDGEVRLDRHKVTQILANLMSNAAHAVERTGRADGRISVTVKRLGQRLAFEVADNGVGIDPGNAALVFSPAFSTGSEGRGLTLHWSALAAREMGGSLDFESAGAGHGARFRLEVPVTPADPGA